MNTLDKTILEIRKAMMSNPTAQEFTLNKVTINYLLTNLQRYITIEETMKKRVASGEKSSPEDVMGIIKGLEDK